MNEERLVVIARILALMEQAKCPNGFPEPSMWEIAVYLYDSGLRFSPLAEKK